MRKLLKLALRIRGSIKRRINTYINKQLLSSVGEGFVCDEGVRIYGGDFIKVGARVVINKGVIIQSCEGATIDIGNDVTFSYDSKLITGNLDYSKDTDTRLHSVKNIKIGNSVWLGANVLILPGVEILDNVVVAAGSVVTKSLLKANCVYGGVPAKEIKVICD